MSDMSIYVACLAAYNAGTLHGKWIDLEGMTLDEVREEIQEMLSESPIPDAEEWAVHDYECPVLAQLGEYPNLEELVEVAEAWEEHGDAYLAYMDTQDFFDPDDFVDSYAGMADSLEDWVVDYVDECGFLQDVPDTIARYFDYQSYARDLELGGKISAVEYNGTTYIFHSY